MNRGLMLLGLRETSKTKGTEAIPLRVNLCPFPLLNFTIARRNMHSAPEDDAFACWRSVSHGPLGAPAIYQPPMILVSVATPSFLSFLI